MQRTPSRGLMLGLLCLSACVRIDPLWADEPVPPLSLAITVDDLPDRAPAPPGTNQLEIVAAMIATLRAAAGPAVYGFANGVPLEWDPYARDVLKAWRQAGFRLGNHTYHHLDLRRVPVEEYLADIEQMEGVLASLSSDGSDVKLFRYPFLREGETLEKRNRVQDYLQRHGYSIAPVTVDYMDWAWTEAYARCARRNDEPTIQWMQEHVVKAARQELRHAQQLATLLFGRDIPHIMLLHLNAFTALSLPAILQAFKADGVRLISLETALTDPVYQINPHLPLADGNNLLEQLAAMRHVEDPFTVHGYDKEKLAQLCAP